MVWFTVFKVLTSRPKPIDPTPNTLARGVVVNVDVVIVVAVIRGGGGSGETVDPLPQLVHSLYRLPALLPEPFPRSHPPPHAVPLLELDNSLPLGGAVCEDIIDVGMVLVLLLQRQIVEHGQIFVQNRQSIAGGLNILDGSAEPDEEANDEHVDREVEPPMKEGDQKTEELSWSSSEQARIRAAPSSSVSLARETGLHTLESSRFSRAQLGR